MSKGSEGIKAEKTKHHSASHAHGSKSGAHDEFVSQVLAFKEAEKEFAKRIEEARLQAQKIEASAREKAVEISTFAKTKAVEEKNSIFSQWQEKTNREIGNMIEEAKKKAEEIKKRKLGESEMNALVAGLLQG